MDYKIAKNTYIIWYDRTWGAYNIIYIIKLEVETIAFSSCQWEVARVYSDIGHFWWSMQ